jgi:hypothetical protein
MGGGRRRDLYRLAWQPSLKNAMRCFCPGRSVGIGCGQLDHSCGKSCFPGCVLPAGHRTETIPLLQSVPENRGHTSSLVGGASLIPAAGGTGGSFHSFPQPMIGRICPGHQYAPYSRPRQSTTARHIHHAAGKSRALEGQRMLRLMQSRLESSLLGPLPLPAVWRPSQNPVLLPY